jgi:subtilisin family serine protease
MKKSYPIQGAVMAAALAATAGAANANPDTDQVLKSLRAGRPHVAGQLLVQYKHGAHEAGLRQALQAEEAPEAETLIAAADHPQGKGALKLVQVPSGQSLDEAIKALGEDADVEYVEPDWILQHQAVSNDPYYTGGRLWGMYGDRTVPSNAYGSKAGEAWAASPDCRNVYVGVIDEGIMKTHEDLAANVWVNPYDPVDGVDNDGNGYVDDVNGWDFAGNDNTVYDGPSDDHATHVAGTITAAGGNGRGVAGACWNAKLISAKFLSSSGGTTSNAVKAIDYITNLKTRHGLNIVATNNSWGGGGYSKALYDAIERANRADILFVAAAGNSSRNVDTGNEYPAKYPNSNIIAVAAITASGGLASFSNYGATSVDLGAPGAGIYSTVPTSSGRSGYASYSGTSMATPHVTGAVALYAATHPGASAAQIKAAILGNTASTPALARRTVTGGRLDVSKALQSR